MRQKQFYSKDKRVELFILYVIIPVFMALIPLAGQAQEPYGSPYNSFGIGNLYNRGFGATDMLGNAAIGYRSPDNINIKNPAAINSIQGYSHIFDMGIEMNFANFETKNQIARLNYGNLSHLNFWFRFTDKWSSSFGLRPFSALEYNITETVSNNNLGNYTVNYQGTGGLSEIYWSHAIKPHKNLSIGVNGAFIFGQLERTETSIDIPSVGSVETTHTEVLRRGSIDFGIQYDINLNKSKLTLGAIWRPEITMTTAFEQKLYANGSDSITSDGFSSYTIPENLGVGLVFQSKRTLVSVDVEKTNWSVNEPGVNFEYKDINTYSIGMERKPDFSSNSMLDHVTYRAGFSLNKYYLAINNTSFNELKWNLGLSIPIKRNTSQINLGYSYTFRGTTENNLIKENYHSVTLGISLKKLWFQRNYYR